MTHIPIRTLLIEDNPGDALLLRDGLEQAYPGRHDVTVASSLEDAGDRLAEKSYDVVLLDLVLPGSRGLDTLDRVREACGTAPIVVITGTNDEEAAMEAVTRGAQDYLVKGRTNGHSLARSIRYAVDRGRMENELRVLNETLEERVAERAAVAQLRAVQLRSLVAELTHAEQRERMRLAQILHDDLQQLLVAAKMWVGMLKSQAQDEEMAATARQVEDLIVQAIQSSRSLTTELCPPALYQIGLVGALEWLVGWMRDTHGFTVNMSVEGREELSMMPDDVKILLFQSVRELLLNVVKHANVKSADLAVSFADGRHAVITVSDKGVGFDAAKAADRGSSGGFGLFSTRERIALIGGWVSVDSRPGGGARVTLRTPLGSHEEAERAHGRGSRSDKRVVDAATRPMPRGADGRIRVLIADDHEIVRDGLSVLLGDTDDIEVVGQAVDGEMAVDLARQLQPDVVVMDVTLPLLGGIEATRAIIADNPGTRVIGLSMHEEAGVAMAMRNAGAACYLTKGGPSELLIEAIRGNYP